MYNLMMTNIAAETCRCKDKLCKRNLVAMQNINSCVWLRLPKLVILHDALLSSYELNCLKPHILFLNKIL
jgi:hypothetical protein